MPALAPVTKVLKVVIQQALVDAASYLINRLFYSYSGTAPTDAELDTFSGSVGTAWIDNITPLQNDIVSLKGVQTEDLTSSTSGVGAAVEDNVGTRSGAALAAGTAFVVAEEIARRYRGGHPRVYLYVGVATDLAAAFAWTGTFAADVVTAFGAFDTAVQAAGWSGAGTLTPVNVSYFSGFTNHTYPSGRTRPIPTPRVTPVVDPILSFIGRESVGSQRRRNEFFD
jgi:hypothetical protein